jgi:hypothetical protein
LTHQSSWPALDHRHLNRIDFSAICFSMLVRVDVAEII